MKQKHFIFSISVLALMMISLVVKHLSPSLIEHLYANKQLLVLNLFSGNFDVTVQSLDFYLGRSREVVFGPLSMVLSGIALILFCLRYLKQLNFWKFTATFFIYFVITKFEVLFFPPYGDSASGPVIEAIWLLHNNFNYAKLAGEEVFVRGGPKVYLFSLYPTYLALLMKMIPHTKTFLAVNHLIIFGLSAVIFSFFRSIARKIFDEKLSVLLSIFLLSLPLVQSQIEQINMEIPVLFFIVLSLYFLSEKKILHASIFSGLAVFTKLYAAYMGGAVFFVGLYLFFFGQEQKKDFKVLGSSILSIFFVITGALCLFLFMDLGGKIDKVGAFQGFALMKTFPISYFYFLSLVAFIAFAFRVLREQGRNSFDNVVNFLNDHYRVVVLFVCSTGWFVLFLNSGWIPPRYTFILLPSLILGIFYVIHILIRNKEIVAHGVMGLILVEFLCSYGLAYTPVTIQDHAIVERSLEYRNDVMLHMELARLVEQKYSNLIVAAPFTFAQALAFPEMGFTRKKLDVMIYLFPCTYEGIRHFEGLENVNPRDVVWVGVKTPFMKIEYLPNGPHDLVIEELQVGNKSANLFIGGFSVNALYHYGQSLVKQLEAQGIKKLELKAY